MSNLNQAINSWIESLHCYIKGFPAEIVPLMRLENDMKKFLEAELAEAQKKPGLLVYSIWEEQERQHLVDIGADCTRISAQKAWQVQQAVIDSLTAELAPLKDELTCEECEQSLVDPETGVTAFCIGCWNAMVTKLRAEIDSLTAENTEFKGKAPDVQRLIWQVETLSQEKKELIDGINKVIEAIQSPLNSEAIVDTLWMPDFQNMTVIDYLSLLQP